MLPTERIGEPLRQTARRMAPARERRQAFAPIESPQIQRILDFRDRLGNRQFGSWARGMTLQRDAVAVQRKVTSDFAAVRKHITTVEGVSTAGDGAVQAIDSHSKKAIVDADSIGRMMSNIAKTFKKAYENHKKVIEEANEVTKSQDDWVKDVAGVAIGTIVGVAGGPVIAAVVATKLLQEAIGELAELGIAKVAESAKGESKEEKPASLTPEGAQLKAAEQLIKLYRDIAVFGSNSKTAHDISLGATKLVADMQAHASKTNKWSVEQTDKFVAALLPKKAQAKAIEQAAAEASAAVARAMGDVMANEALSTELELEKDIWVRWMAENDMSKSSTDTCNLISMAYVIGQHLQSLGLTQHIQKGWLREVGEEGGDTKKETKARELRGQRGNARSELNPGGEVEINGELWQARLSDSSDCVPALGEVRVVGVDAERLNFDECQMLETSRELPVTLLVAPVRPD